MRQLAIARAPRVPREKPQAARPGRRSLLPVHGVPVRAASARTTPRRRRERQARALLCWALAGFPLVQLLLSLASFYWLPELREPLFWRKVKRFEARLAARPAATGVAFLGSSRTIYGVAGRAVEEELSARLERPVVAGNLGAWGAGPIHQLVNLERLLAWGIRPDVVVIEVLPMLFDDVPEPSELQLLPAEKLSANDLRVVLGHRCPCPQLESDWWQSVLLPAHWQKAAILCGISESLLPVAQRVDCGRSTDVTGWEPLKGAGQSAEVWEATRQEYQPRLAALRVGGHPCRAFEEMLALARRAGLRVCVVLMPEGPLMQSWYVAEPRRQLEDFVQAACARHDAALIDARSWLPEESFRDSHHLYPPGAQQFSRQLGTELARQLTER